MTLLAADSSAEREVAARGLWNPVSTSMQCVISLTIQYMFVYAAFALASTAAKSMGIDYGKTLVIRSLRAPVHSQLRADDREFVPRVPVKAARQSTSRLRCTAALAPSSR